MKKICTVPNLLSFLRILLIPLYVYMYLFSTAEYHFYFAMLIWGVSGLTDVADGIIARRFNLVTDFGKIIDPIADKLTQVTVLICITLRHPRFLPLVIIICIKEFLILIGVIIMLRTNTKTPSARWWGKLATVALFAAMVTIMIKDVWTAMPPVIPIIVVTVAICCVIFSLCAYAVMFINIQSEDKKSPEKTQ